ncbi:MAG: hypothetical protein E7398_03725 [Ruminococcaceae bacterium]|nr:hypothetical protein [Oscillospiraceae bacterium]
MKKITRKGTYKRFSQTREKLSTSAKKSNKISFLSALKIGSVFAGAILGAGFAGGRELVTFFVRFGKYGVLASLFAGLLFLIFGTAIIYKAKSTRCTSYIGYLENILPKKTAYIMNAISEMFLLICFIIMLSGAGALFNECFGVSRVFGSIITALISFLVLRGGMKGIGSVCSIMTPVMIIGIIYVDLFSLTTSSVPVFGAVENSKDNFLFSALLYVSYNMLSSAPVLTESSALAQNKKTALAGGITGGILLSIIAFLSCLALHLTDSENLLCELPLLMLSGKINKFSHIFYALILYMAILTTAFSTGYPIVRKLENFSISRSLASFFLCFFSIWLSFLRFSLLVEKCYTFFGILGLMLIGAMLFNIIKTLKNNEFRSKI